jgi:hypothetical protein
VLRSVRIAATYGKVGLTPRYSRALHLNIFEQPKNFIFHKKHIILFSIKILHLTPTKGQFFIAMKFDDYLLKEINASITHQPTATKERRGGRVYAFVMLNSFTQF